MYIKSDKIYTESGVVKGYLNIEDGKIKNILSSDEKVDDFHDFSTYRIIPGIFDTHIHGVMGYNLMNKTPDVISEIKGFLKGISAHGVTSVLPTANPEIFKDLVAVSRMSIDGAKIIGIHSEGPYLNRVGEKGIDEGHPDISLDYIQEMISNCEGMLKLVGMAPELPNSKQATEYLLNHGVRVAFTHSNANFEEAMNAFKNGVSISTHTANVMTGIHHRDVGGLGASLLAPNVECEIICDGLHVSFEMLEIMFRIKSYDRFIMISDSTHLAGAPIGQYESMGLTINITDDGFAKTDTGRLVGSTKSIMYGIKNLVEKMNIPLEIVLNMACLNPARTYGVDRKKGSLVVGKDADFVIIDDEYSVVYTFSEGEVIYDASTDKDLFNTKMLVK
ncbi:N-acetylglucosamine-6-phosphate deacetylase [Fundicoccus culcitae]|uniref:N-acetylglucosamine-6-phosphate deacetylase n=1 Tax=Fundicoccus culcitae TaxID=2969821 RepID=A0ABY5P8V1_9LACT|nr:N-acetylglucosamine-6-phosphate deacetylase [Fundicoccus culcitae]UUX35172.1 N-acetylglucosamine-6-phosphate deacetylase [Fundicoccus culcitae]